MNKEQKINLLIKEYSNIFFFWLVGTIYFFLFRVSFILLYHSDIGNNVSIIDYIKTFFQGFRFDITVISYFIALPFLSAMALIPLNKYEIQKKIRITCQWIFTIISVLISIITLSYYREYNDQFNYFLFMGLHDDKTSVLHSILTDFNPIINTITIFALIYIVLKTFKHFEHKNRISNFLNYFQFKYKGIIYSIIFIILFIGSLRASFTDLPIRRFYASVTSDEFLNKTITNPIRSLNYAISDYKKLTKTHDKNPFKEITPEIKNRFSRIEESIHHQYKNEQNETPPQQIFLIIMESYDNWCLTNPICTKLGINKALNTIKNKGVSFENFVPSANSTMNSFSSIITNVPHTGVNMSLKGANTLYPSSIFSQFKSLGYETNFFYAGFSSWQNIKNFTRRQGANNIYCAGGMKGETGIWGVNDAVLFNEVLEKVDTAKKSINVILTLSYHSPYEIDLKKEKFNYLTYKDIPNDLKKVYKEDKISLKAIGHLWYADKAIGEFVSKAEQKYPNALFAFTGDHWGRKYFDATKTSLYDKNTVPFILYGKTVQEIIGKKHNGGSHIDITPTLLSLVMPKNYDYYSFGKNLFDENTKNTIGIGVNKAIDSQMLQEFNEQGDKKQFFNNKTIDKDFKSKRDSLLSISWHYVMKGDSL